MPGAGRGGSARPGGGRVVSGPREPVIATVSGDPSGPGDRNALADVLIVAGDGRPSVDHCAHLFARYPGLSLAVIAVADGAFDVGWPDGPVLTVRGAGPAPLSRADVEALVDLLAAWWIRGRRQLRHPLPEPGGAR
jgi:hypothetical protein